jgi:ubiquitin carboxyl-terminal hydrolase 4/11/15
MDVDVVDKTPSDDNITANGNQGLQQQQELVISDKYGRLGIRNLGNTCYMNAALQCIFHTSELVDYFNKKEHIKDLNNSEEQNEKYKEFTNYFFEMLQQKWYPGKFDSEPINPTNLKNILVKIRSEYEKGQQDSHELLTHVIDILHEQLKRADANNGIISDLQLSRGYTQMCEENNKLNTNDSFIMETFFGELRSTTKCLKCFKSKTNYEKFSSLGLPIPNEYKIMVYFIPIRKGGKPVKLYIDINDNMQYKKIVTLIQNKIEYSFVSGIFYLVLGNKLVNIIDMEERCGDLMNRNAFLFLIENKTDDINGMAIDNIGIKYICANFNQFDASKEVHQFKHASYPRIFSFNYYNNVINFIEIFDYLKDYIKQFINKEDFTLDENSIYYTIDSINHECIICNKTEDHKFSCKCINSIVTGGDSDSKLSAIALKTFDDVINININISQEYLKYKELNKCIDLTSVHTADSRITLYDLLDYFTSDEKLSSEDSIKCTTCQSNSKAMKKMEINKAPKILIINLKRFRYDYNNMNKSRAGRGNSLSHFSGEKNENLVDFEIDNLDMSKYMTDQEGDSHYQLFAVCYHDGRIDTGHYYAVCKHETKWIEYNDKLVKEYTDEIVNHKAYMLFYRKKN